MSERIFEAYQNVFEGYEKIFEKCRNDYHEIFLNNFHLIESTLINFSKEYRTLLQEKKEQDKYKAWDFSIFNVVKINRLEENLHSPLLFELLNTQGKHGQQDLFYKLFINQFLTENAENFINDKNYHYYFKKEEFLRTDDKKGRIDILIKSTNPKKKFAILIENKWNSGDSCPDQLYKYYISLTKRQGYTDKNLLIFYLTKHGDNPKWVENDDFERFLEKNININYFPISYRREIFKWLTNCQLHCKSEKVINIIEQYKLHIS